MRDIGSIGEQSGRTTGRLGSTGLQAVPSEGKHSWHSGAHHPPPPSSPGRVTLSDDYGPGRSSRRMDLAAAAAGDRVTRISLSRAGRSSWRTWAGAISRYAD